jgi:hypothetical protein
MNNKLFIEKDISRFLFRIYNFMYTRERIEKEKKTINQNMRSRRVRTQERVHKCTHSYPGR